MKNICRNCEHREQEIDGGRWICMNRDSDLCGMEIGEEDCCLDFEQKEGGNEMKKRQVIVSWYTPDEKLPEDGQIVIATISGKRNNVRYDGALLPAEYYSGDGWYCDEFGETGSYTVEAWCDLEPYGR